MTCAAIYWKRVEKQIERRTEKIAVMEGVAMKHRRMQMKWSDLVIVMLVLLSDCEAAADTRYVTDLLVITMRVGQGDEYAAVQTLKSDTVVDVIEESKDYLKIKTQEGKTGWVKKRYLTTKTPNSIIIDKLEKEIERLQLEMARIAAENGTSDESQDHVRPEQAATIKDCEAIVLSYDEKIVNLKNELEQSKKQYQTLVLNSGNTADLIKKSEAADNKAAQLQEEGSQLAVRLKKLQEENAQLKLYGMIRWFVAGGMVLLIGIIIGKMSRKKSYY